MKRVFLAVPLVMMLTCAARATLITFDNITPWQVYLSQGQVPEGYGGLGWENFYVGPSVGDEPAESVGQSIISGLSGALITLNGAELSNPAGGQEPVEVIGIDDGTALYNRTYILGGEYAWYEFDYVGIQYVIFRAPGWNGELGPEVSFAMTELEVNDPVIPEPATTLAGVLALLPLAIAGVRKLKGKWIGRRCRHG
jgi:hypothetical protein